MAEGYQMIGAIADPGGITEIGYNGFDLVIRPGGKRVITLDAAKREEWQRLFAAAEWRAEAHEPSAEVMKILRNAFFKGTPDASEDDWRRYCELIGPEVAEKYGEWTEVSDD